MRIVSMATAAGLWRRAALSSEQWPAIKLSRSHHASAARWLLSLYVMTCPHYAFYPAGRNLFSKAALGPRPSALGPRPSAVGTL